MTSLSLDPPALVARAAAGANRLRLATGRSPLGRVEVVRAIVLEPRWLVPIAIAAYVTWVTWDWEFPNHQGIPFPPVWIGAAIAVLVVFRQLGRAFTPLSIAAALTVTAMVATDITLFWSQRLRDLTLYLKAGEAWLAGAQVYSHVPVAVRPLDLSDYPYLYPPVTLPLFGGLSVLPFELAAVMWIGASLAAVLWGLRRIGFSWRWCVLMIAWPGIAQGLYVGNVAVPLFALFAGAVARPSVLTVPPLFKLYSGVASLWLLRREHWGSLLLGSAVVLGMSALSVVLAGVQPWIDWVRGLQTYQVSQELLRDYLFGFGLGRYMPLWLVAVFAVIVTVMALRASERREQLARLGVATVVASPSLFGHGWLVALPSMVRLETLTLWLVLGITACAPGLAWFVALVIVLLAWYVPALRKPPGDDPWHPLGAATMPWPQEGDGVGDVAAPADRRRAPGLRPSSVA